MQRLQLKCGIELKNGQICDRNHAHGRGWMWISMRIYSNREHLTFSIWSSRGHNSHSFRNKWSRTENNFNRPTYYVHIGWWLPFLHTYTHSHTYALPSHCRYDLNAHHKSEQMGSWFGLCHFVFLNHSWRSNREISEYERSRFFCLRSLIASGLMMRIVCIKLSRARRYFGSRTYMQSTSTDSRHSLLYIQMCIQYFLWVFFDGFF